MAAGKHSSSEWIVSYDTSPGGSLTAITNHVITIGGLEIESIQQLTHALGDSWEESTPTGIRRVPPIEITGFFDDTATTGPHTVMRVTDDDVDPNGSTRTFTAVVSNTTKTFSGETRLTKYKVLGKNGNLTEFAATIQPTGAFTWS
jgi:hypothetical protein